MNFNLWNNSSSIDSIYTVTGEEVNMIIHYTNKETKEIQKGVTFGSFYLCKDFLRASLSSSDIGSQLPWKT